MHPATFLTGADEAGVLESFQVERQLGLSHLEHFAEFADAELPLLQQLQDLQAQGVREGVEAGDNLSRCCRRGLKHQLFSTVN